MIHTIKIEKEVDLKFLQVMAGVRYWDDATINGEKDIEGSMAPCKNGEVWCPKINIETGVIVNWKQGVTADIHYKVVDCCSWHFIDAEGGVLLEVKNEYVPNTLSPEDKGYGDYIIMKINADGYISNWHFDIDDFIKED